MLWQLVRNTLKTWKIENGSKEIESPSKRHLPGQSRSCGPTGGWEDVWAPQHPVQRMGRENRVCEWLQTRDLGCLLETSCIVCLQPTALPTRVSILYTSLAPSFWSLLCKYERVALIPCEDDHKYMNDSFETEWWLMIIDKWSLEGKTVKIGRLLFAH